MSDTSLQIAGLQPLSTVDWPHKLAAVAFLQGCPWRCTYCHNYEILSARAPGVVPWEDVVALLGRRHGLLDGLVFSGGEATRQDALLPAATQVKDMGFQVGLHTAGAYPKRLARLLEAGVVDWVGLDVKALPEHYPEITRVAASGSRTSEALDVLMAHPEVDHEVRLTLWHDELSYAEEVANWCYARGVRKFALQRANSQGAPADFVMPRQDWSEAQALDILSGVGFEEFAVRM